MIHLNRLVCSGERKLYSKNLALLLLIALPWFAHGDGKSQSAFTHFSDDWNIRDGDSHVIQNMPKATSQQSLGICFAYTASTVFNYYNCRILGVKDCKSVPSGDLASPLDMARYGKAAVGDVSYESSYRGIPDGGGGIHAMEASTILVGSVASQACLDLRMVLGDSYVADGNMNEANIKAQREVISNFKRFYTAYKANGNSPVTVSDAVMQDLASFFPAQSDKGVVARALQENSYPDFFDRMVTRSVCKRAKNRAYFEGKDKMEIHFYPDDSKKKATLQGMTKGIRRAIDHDNPVIIEGICITKNKGSKCPKENLHSMVIYGYAELCDLGGICRFGLKLRDSNGDNMNAFFERNWIDAEKLLKSIDDTRQFLGWLEEKPQPKEKADQGGKSACGCG